MPVNPDTTIRKNVAFPRELWAEVEDFRFENRIGTESKAVLRLVEAGLAVAPMARTLEELLERLQASPAADALDIKELVTALRSLLGPSAQG